jgi:L-ascorbate metabolism protein UlaG (beta-lactamase superfamily)
MWSSLFAFALAASLHAMAPADTIQAKGGPITIQPITHAALQLKYGNQVITVDPTMMGGDYNALPKADIILVTDIHGDHWTPPRSRRPRSRVPRSSSRARHRHR